MNIPILLGSPSYFSYLACNLVFFLGHLFLVFALATDSYLRMGFGKQ